MVIAEFGHFGTLAPGIRAIVRNENICWLRTGEFEIRNVGVIGHPAHVPRRHSLARLTPRLAEIVGAKHAICRASQDHSLARDQRGDVFPGESARGWAPFASDRKSTRLNSSHQLI